MDRDTLTMLVTEHQTSIYRYLRYLGARGAAEDLTQDTFLAAFKSASPPDMTNAPLRAAWLRGISRNCLLAHWRRGRADPVRVDSEYLRQAEDVWSAQFAGASGEGDYVEALRKCVETLDDRDRRMLDLRYAGGKSRSEMADLCRMSEDGIKSLLRRIRSRLGRCVRRRLASGADQ